MVTIIDRTGEQKEFKYDQRVYEFRGKPQLVLPLETATWLFRSSNEAHWVHTVNGRFERRYGVVDAPEDWVTEVGTDVLETSAVTRDTSRVEAWDAEAVDPFRSKATVLDLTKTAHRERPGDYVNQGEPSRARS